MILAWAPTSSTWRASPTWRPATASASWPAASARTNAPSPAGRGRAQAAALAARWAAKEAFLKALGADVRTIPYRDVEVVRDPAGPVTLRLHGRAAAGPVRPAAAGGCTWR